MTTSERGLSADGATGGAPRALLILGLTGMALGLLDPLEGSIAVVIGSGFAALGGAVGRSRHRDLLIGAFTMVALGVAALWVVSAFGGLSMRPGAPGIHPAWGALFLPYPIGWLLGIVTAILAWRELRRRPSPRVSH
jgi:hypothetical protein